MTAFPDNFKGRKVDRPNVRHLARWALTAFVITFIVARILVYLIMAGDMPDLYMHVGGTHIHHLNYGIFLLSAIGAYLLFYRPAGGRATAAAVAYGIGLGLTFDEFGMWLHLGGGYWQRASFDAIVVVAGLLALIAEAPRLKQFRPVHWRTAVLLGVAVTIFAVLLIQSFKYAGRVILPRLQQLDGMAPPQGQG
ncbi:MAG TPA: hypothetical protein VMV94_07685 [Phycisphaerae bacterium]|nr:hypothetical protein [Phycisphaerae bacterium]